MVDTREKRLIEEMAADINREIERRMLREQREHLLRRGVRVAVELSELGRLAKLVAPEFCLEPEALDALGVKP